MNPVVDLKEIEEGIFQIKMEDRESKNTFSEKLVDGLIKSFESVNKVEHCKVVILTGYDSYFSTGGTQEALMALHEGHGKFTDINFYRFPLDCRIPVISAMQGHGIGGGFAMGLFADFVILSRESVYTTNFMKYGFTPGMGATLIVPYKLGNVLGCEMLMNAQTYRGQDLKERGVPYPVVPRDEVLELALTTARQLAEKPKVSLVTLKRHLVEPLEAALASVVEKEVKMHEKTFHQEEVKMRIKNLF